MKGSSQNDDNVDCNMTIEMYRLNNAPLHEMVYGHFIPWSLRSNHFVPKYDPNIVTSFQTRSLYSKGKVSY